MAPLCLAAKFDPILSWECAPTPLHPGAIPGKEGILGIKLCHLATLVSPSSLEASPKTAAYSLGLQLLPRHELREVERGDGAAPPVFRGSAVLLPLPGFVLGSIDYLLEQGSVGFIYRDRQKGLYVVVKSLFLPLFTCSACPCVGPA